MNRFRLEEFGVDLTAKARRGTLDPVCGRDREIKRLIRILARKTKNNPVLLGEPGVGKTAIVEGLAQRIVGAEVPPHLAGVTLFSLNLGSLLAGTGCRGDFEARLQELVGELRRVGTRRLLFVDELHLLGKAGRSEGGLDAGNLLKPLLARGELPCIGASTPEEWNELVALDPALERRFQTIAVREPTTDETLDILRGLRARYEVHHGVEITDEALQAAVTESMVVAPARRLPDKAVDLLDEACAMARLNRDGEESADWRAAQQAVAEAADRFDLEAFAQLRARVVPGLQAGPRPRLDGTSIRKACDETRR